MKKLFALILLISLALCACGVAPTAQEKVGNALGIDLSAAELLSENDTHGGFHGDGETIIQLRVGDISTLINGKEGWHELPVDEDMLRLTPQFGDIESGCWYFYDRHSKATDPYDYSAVNGRFSYNFSFAVYDSEAGLLNYYELDT